MARAGVTYEEVMCAAQQVVATGKTPTLEAIRQVLGTGSQTTLSMHLRRWKAQQDQTQEIATRAHLPEVLIATLQGLWTHVMDHAEAHIHTIEQAAQAERRVLQTTVQALENEQSQGQQRFHTLQEERDRLAYEKSTLEPLLMDGKIVVATLEQKNQGLVQQTQDQHTHLDELRRQNQQIQANLEHYRETSHTQRQAEQHRHEQQYHVLEQTLRHVQQELAQRTEEKSAVQQEAQQTRFENERLQQQVETWSTQQAALQARLAEALEAAAHATQSQQHWQAQWHTLSEKGEAQHRALLEFQTKQAVLLQQTADTQQTLQELQAHNKALTHEKWILGQEKAQVMGQLQQLQTMRTLAR